MAIKPDKLYDTKGKPTEEALEWACDIFGYKKNRLHEVTEKGLLITYKLCLSKKEFTATTVLQAMAILSSHLNFTPTKRSEETNEVVTEDLKKGIEKLRPATSRSSLPIRNDDYGGEDGYIEVFVTDSETHRGIQGATVSVSNWPSRNTNREGIARIPIRRRGRFRVAAKKSGYSEGFGITRELRSRDDSDFVEIALNPKRQQRITVPGLPSSVPLQNVAGLLIGIVAGLALSALFGSMWFFFGFLCLGLHFILPEMGDIDSVKLAMRKMRAKGYKALKAIAKSDISESEKTKRMAELTKAIKDSMLVDKIIAETPGIKGKIYPVVILKHSFKIGAIVFFVLGISIVPLPFAKLIALIGAFIGYFIIGGFKEPEKE